MSIFQNMVLGTCLFMSVACTTTTIHVNQLYLTDKESQNIQAALEEQGFSVEFNNLLYPTDISSTSIIYSPFVTDKNAVDKLEDTLIFQGYSVSNVNALVSSNHWYTKDTIGLFIVPDGIKPHSGKNIEDIAFQYKSEDCDISSELHLQKNGLFSYKKLDSLNIVGKWSVTGYPYILLENDTPYLHFYYEIIRSKSVDKISEIEVIELKPVNNSSIISNCRLTYGVRI